MSPIFMYMYNIGLEPLFSRSWLAFPHPLGGLFLHKNHIFFNNFKSIIPRAFKFGMWIDMVVGLNLLFEGQ